MPEFIINTTQVVHEQFLVEARDEKRAKEIAQLGERQRRLYGRESIKSKRAKHEDRSITSIQELIEL